MRVVVDLAYWVGWWRGKRRLARARNRPVVGGWDLRTATAGQLGLCGEQVLTPDETEAFNEIARRTGL